MKLIKNLGLLITVLIIFSCEKMVKTDEIADVITENDLDIELKIDTQNDYEIQRISKNEENNNYLKIIVADEFYLRGKAKIKTNQKYKLSVTLKNNNANPVVLYSFWKGLKTSKRSFTLAGKNENPPTSETQKTHSDWITFEESFQAQKDEDSFMIVIFSRKGIFYLKDIKIEQVMD
ncbi:hypothetical protein [uncultured Lutibacter sp.]|uniref:hypothetical protein n=1 Tax=uncultured Lutibacter sp. TaxID=437739 RepID=UPI00260D2D79|nr:hypothetical protein [uncultured Lutibacter sp.]